VTTGKFRSLVFSLQSSFFRPRSSVSRLQSAVRSLWSTVHGLRSSVFRLPSSVFVVLAVLAFAAQAPGQAGSVPVSQAPVFKYYVWGQVRSPGAYSLGANPDLIELLSAGGGPTAYANLRRVVLVRAVTQKRTNVNLQRTLEAGQVVPLFPGDVVIVSSSSWYYIRDGLSVVASFATLATLVLTIVNGVGR
jgi:hypothetical protein